jgi:MscS family membrane protein
MNLLTKIICRRSLITSVIVLFFILLLPIVSLNVESGQNDLATAAVNKDTADKADSAAKERNRDMGVSTQEADKIGNKLGEGIDNLSQRATSQFGDWMSIDIYAGISWFKLFLILFLIITVVFIERKISRLVDKTKRKIEARNAQQGFRYLMIDAASKPISMFIWIYGIYIVATPLLVLFQQPNGLNIVKTIAQKGVDFGSAVAVIWFIVRLVAIVEYRIKSWSSSADDNIDEILAPLVGKILRTFTVIIGGILIIQNLTGVKMGPLLASLGIGGIAIALAAKDSIANFFGTLTILLDKPFKIGQRVVIDNSDGMVEEVGFRTTRIRLFSGHLVSIPNEKVVNSTVENIGKRPYIRWKTTVAISYDTPVGKVEKAVSVLEEILDNHEGMQPERPPRVYFNEFGEWSLNIMAMAWYHPPDYWKMQTWQMQTCLEILKQFNAAGIQFAFPSRSIYLANDDRRQLKLKMLKGETEIFHSNDRPENGDFSI